ncbi:hypothetical protein H5410_040374 [Solanum commersonii]|uniref:60S ribosomal protein L18a-like protein n=1 Tax=Solanum commersonii TaxID=4109 RepID=A0A9J5XR76_SOLCO|nr:hypothetical protein H5410_040374 [Solanum commersonii]
MSEEGGKMNREAPATVPSPANYFYGTFQGVANYQTPPSHSQSVLGFSQPIPPPGVPVVPPCYYPHGYQTVQGWMLAMEDDMKSQNLIKSFLFHFVGKRDKVILQQIWREFDNAALTKVSNLKPFPATTWGWPGLLGRTRCTGLMWFTIPMCVSSKGYIVAEGRPIREHRLPCCGMGIGWFMFIIGFFLGAIPWYIGAFLLLCAQLDYREKPGFIACTLAATLALVAVTLGVTKVNYTW